MVFVGIEYCVDSFFFISPGCFLGMHSPHLNVSDLWRRTRWTLKKLNSGVNTGKSPYVHSNLQTWSPEHINFIFMVNPLYIYI